MVRVLQLIQHCYCGGLEKMVLSLCQRGDTRVSTVLVSLEGTEEDAVQDWPQLTELKGAIYLDKSKGFSFKTVKQLGAIIDALEIDVVHSHHIGPLLYGALAIVNRPHVKHVHTVHDAWYLSNAKARWFTRMICVFSRVIIVADAESVANSVREVANISPDYVVHNAIDTQYFTPLTSSQSRHKLQLPMNKTLVGCAARIEDGKGHEAMLRSLINLPESVEMVFAGDGSQLNRYREYAEKIGVASRVHWLGCVSEMPLFYSAIDVFCLFSQREGLPLSILEAMACNRPVVASDVGGIHEVMAKKSGFLIAPDNEQALPFRILAAIRLRKRHDFRPHAVKNMDIRSMAQHYYDIYQSAQMTGGRL